MRTRFQPVRAKRWPRTSAAHAGNVVAVAIDGGDQHRVIQARRPGSLRPCTSVGGSFRMPLSASGPNPTAVGRLGRQGLSRDGGELFSPVAKSPGCYRAAWGRGCRVAACRGWPRSPWRASHGAEDMEVATFVWNNAGPMPVSGAFNSGLAGAVRLDQQ